MSNYWHMSKVFTDGSSCFRHIPFLVYHSIIADNAPITHPGYDVFGSRLESQMRFLYDHGYSCLTLTELCQSPKMEQTNRKKTFVLTFDDGYEDFYSRAYPILHRYGFTATVFLVTDLIGKAKDCNSETWEPRMTWEQIKALNAERFSFGSHTCSHARLPDLNHEQVRNELTASRESMEAGLGHKILTLAYPYGESSPAIREMAMQAGYQGAFGVNTGEPGDFNRWRTVICTKDSVRGFALKLTSWYSCYIRLRGWVRENTAVGRYLRRVKHYRRQTLERVGPLE